MNPDRTTPRDHALTAAFLPLDKLAMGVAVGVASAILVYLATAIYIVRRPHPGFDLGLLAQFFAGYSVTWTGGLVGAAWAAFAGFVLGWFLAFARNFIVATIIFVVRTRAELAQTRDFLDHM